ncbi:Reverse transcriptase RNA-dependent DNA polymerase [Arabidopsis thaliana x Arabidopsis arenosa]|uniref:Reverse transcriptase RNA-dependent DNA polymerase n=1 Tax=Arabidopsis thaliana x Arabidopsis arenosa TaxID=1240361 RepID=A0A8T1XF53_9BRAS|nr:Reverse transcriptase RNA-dependent DNA polymerase [Arabidopsis thaliana x Arabidopsis arenosa]
MEESKAPQKFWVEAFFTANFLSNLLPTTVLDSSTTPYEVLFGKTPNYSALRTFGCACFPTLRQYAHNKFDPRSLKCIFLGYTEKYKGYRCYYPPTGRVYLSRHVIFDESSFPFIDTYAGLKQSALTPLLDAWIKGFSNMQSASEQEQTAAETINSSVPAINIVQQQQDQLTVPNIEGETSNNTSNELLCITPIQIITSQENDAVPESSSKGNEECTECTASSDLVPIGNSAPSLSPRPENSVSSSILPSTTESIHPMTTRLKKGIVKPNPRYALLTHKVSYPMPTTVTEALKDPNWTAAMLEEMGNCSETQTWSLVPLTSKMHVLGSKWVFRVKLHADGSLDKYKARLVAQGFKQEEGIDYLETYSPVVRSATVRAVLHLATVMEWELKQMDVKNAFLHGDLTETVYMKQPAGFIDKDHPNHVCLLHKSLYGLKQSPRAWFDKFSKFLLSFGFICSMSDPSLFICVKNRDVIMLLLYVDDMVITGNSSKLLSDLLHALNQQFKMKDLGRLSYFLGIQAQFHSKGLFLSQQKYAEDLLATAAMSHCSPVATPLPLQPERAPHQTELFDNPTYFRSLAGKLQYLTLTRPDLQFSVNYVCQKMHAPTVSDFHLLKRILRYIKGTTTMGIAFNKATDCKLRAYSDSDHAGCMGTRRSTMGFYTFLGNNLISWCLELIWDIMDAKKRIDDSEPVRSPSKIDSDGSLSLRFSFRALHTSYRKLSYLSNGGGRAGAQKPPRVGLDQQARREVE